MLSNNDKSKFIFTLIIISSCCLYIAKITSFSPVYIILLFINIIIFFHGFLDRNLLTNFNITTAIIFILCIYMTINVIITNHSISTYINFIVAAISCISLIAMKPKSILIIKSYNIAENFILLILFTDTIFRLYKPDIDNFIYSEKLQESYYYYKFGTYMFADSNTIALLCLSFIFFNIYLRNIIGVDKKYQRYIFTIILFSCLSKSAIVSYLISRVVLTRRISKFSKLMILPVIFYAIIFYGLSFMENDGSGKSKIYIVNLFKSYLSDIDLYSLLYGVGLDGSIITFKGIYAHILPITIFTEIGLIGTFLYLTILLLLLFKSFFKILYIIIPIAIASLSYFFYLGSPFIFIPITLIYILEINNHEKNSFYTSLHKKNGTNTSSIGYN